MTDKQTNIINEIKKYNKLTRLQIAELLYGKGSEQSIVYYPLEDLVKKGIIIKVSERPCYYLLSGNNFENKNIITDNELKFICKNVVIDLKNIDLKNTIYKFYNEIIEDENARYKSWEHCHDYFITHKDDVTEDTIDLMCLHLAFYLASWGMLRGSSFLLQKDYKIHSNAVKIMLDKKYEILWNCEPEILESENALNLLFECTENISKSYLNKNNHRKPSDTLLTKILLGVFGCVPAYDRYFVNAIKEYGGIGKFNKKSIKLLCEFYNENRNELLVVKNELNNQNQFYTSMKIIDMLFWQLGYDEDNSSN